MRVALAPPNAMRWPDPTIPCVGSYHPMTSAPPSHLVASSAYGVVCLLPPSPLISARPSHLVASSAYGVLSLMPPNALTSAPPCPDWITARRYSHSDNAERGAAVEEEEREEWSHKTERDQKRGQRKGCG